MVTFYLSKYKTDMAKIWEWTTGQLTHQNHYKVEWTSKSTSKNVVLTSKWII